MQPDELFQDKSLHDLKIAFKNYMRATKTYKKQLIQDSQESDEEILNMLRESENDSCDDISLDSMNFQDDKSKDINSTDLTMLNEKRKSIVDISKKRLSLHEGFSSWYRGELAEESKEQNSEQKL
jgi:hypothetical protein